MRERKGSWRVLVGGNLKKSNNFEDVVVNGRIILNWNLEIRMHGQQNIKKPQIPME
jgi:hypothetical protein